MRHAIENHNPPQPSICVPPTEVKLERFAPVSEADVHEIILSSSNASCQLDPSPTLLLKKCVDVLVPTITKLINSPLESGCVPDTWKIACGCCT